MVQVTILQVTRVSGPCIDGVTHGVLQPCSAVTSVLSQDPGNKVAQTPRLEQRKCVRSKLRDGKAKAELWAGLVPSEAEQESVPGHPPASGRCWQSPVAPAPGSITPPLPACSPASPGVQSVSV